MRRLLTGLLGATLLLGACGDDDDNGDQAAVTSIPDETTTSTITTTEPRTVAPDVIPQDVSHITEEYVEQVLNELYVAANEALRSAMEEGMVGETSIGLIEATSSRATVAEDLNALLDLSLRQFPGFRPDPDPLRAEVIDVLRGDGSCVFAEIVVDRSGPLLDPPPRDGAVRNFARLTPATPEQVASGLNPTAWVTDGLPTTTDGSVPDGGCSV